MSARNEHSAHLLESRFEIVEITGSVGDRDGIERLVIEGEGCGVVLHEEDDVVQSCRFHLFAPHIHHPLADVYPDNAVWIQTLSCEYGEIARSCSDIKYRLRCKRFQGIDGFASPAAVDSE